MKYAFYIKKNRKEAEDFKAKIEKYLDKSFIYDDKNPDVVITVGGDGTFLEAAHNYMDIIDKVSFVPFMTGHIGFFIDFFEEDIPNINSIINDEENYKDIPLLEATIKGDKYYAINEFSLGQFAHASLYDIYMDDILIETYYGSGILFSTTYGSSAYNRSVGGPLVDIGLKAMIVSKIAPISSRSYNSITSPMVYSGDKILTLVYKNKHHQVLTMDNKIKEFEYLDKVEVKLSNKTVKLHTKKQFDYFARIRKAC